MTARLYIFTLTLVFASGAATGWGLSHLYGEIEFPARPEPLTAPTRLQADGMAEADPPPLVKLGSQGSAVVVLYADLQAFDAVDERGTLTVPAGTYARIEEYYPWNDSAFVRIATGPVKGRAGVTLRTNLRKLSR